MRYASMRFIGPSVSTSVLPIAERKREVLVPDLLAGVDCGRMVRRSVTAGAQIDAVLDAATDTATK
jgi:hypothetical protein